MGLGLGVRLAAATKELVANRVNGYRLAGCDQPVAVIAALGGDGAAIREHGGSFWFG